MEYGKVVSRLREERNMSMRDFGKLVGVDFTYIGQLEKEKSKIKGQRLSPSIDTLKQICDRTGYPFRLFLEEAGYVEPVEQDCFATIFSALSKTGQAAILTSLEAAVEFDSGFIPTEQSELLKGLIFKIMQKYSK